MKVVKIILVVVVVGAIGFFVVKSFVKRENSPIPTPPRNQFIERIESKINSLTNSPANVFCKELYIEIQYLINDYYKQTLLGNNENDNDHWKNILSRNLYSAYATKFIQQAMYVFSNSQWQFDDLSFIRSEIKILQNSTYLDKGSSVYNSFQNMLTILAKYDEISEFINKCRSYLYSDYEISDKFPMNDVVSDKIQTARNYLTNRLDNEYVNNCSRLHTGLNEVHQILFSKHINYLLSKIQYWSGRWREYASQKDYSDRLYMPLKNEIGLLDNNIYGIDQYIFDNNYSNLIRELNLDNINAYKYFSSRESK